MAGINSDNFAVMSGYSLEVEYECPEASLFLLVKPDTDFDSRFRAYDTDEQEWLFVNGGLGIVTRSKYHLTDEDRENIAEENRDKAQRRSGGLV